MPRAPVGRAAAAWSRSSSRTSSISGKVRPVPPARVRHARRPPGCVNLVRLAARFGVLEVHPVAAAVRRWRSEIAHEQIAAEVRGRAVRPAAGVTKGTFYKHFESKDDLVLAAVRRRDEWEAQAWARAVHKLAGDDPVR